MKRTLVRDLSAAALLAASTLLLAACGDKQVGSKVLRPIHAGMPRDSVLQIMGARGPLTGYYSDTLRLERGFRHSAYLINGKSYEVLYYREEPGNVAEPVLQEVETPVVVSDGKALGWGWKYYVQAMKEFGLPTPLQETPKAQGQVPVEPKKAKQ